MIVLNTTTAGAAEPKPALSDKDAYPFQSDFGSVRTGSASGAWKERGTGRRRTYDRDQVTTERPRSRSRPSR
ncbi:MAG TPA: hypothetical protein VFG43_10385 [Geminicoccaceae bacterium]|nr:hypothetical protein [Geminicoccaceae bacterium]